MKRLRTSKLCTADCAPSSLDWHKPPLEREGVHAIANRRSFIGDVSPLEAVPEMAPALRAKDLGLCLS